MEADKYFHLHLSLGLHDNRLAPKTVGKVEDQILDLASVYPNWRFIYYCEGIDTANTRESIQALKKGGLTFLDAFLLSWALEKKRVAQVIYNRGWEYVRKYYKSPKAPGGIRFATWELSMLDRLPTNLMVEYTGESYTPQQAIEISKRVNCFQFSLKQSNASLQRGDIDKGTGLLDQALRDHLAPLTYERDLVFQADVHKVCSEALSTKQPTVMVMRLGEGHHGLIQLLGRGDSALPQEAGLTFSYDYGQPLHPPYSELVDELIEQPDKVIPRHCFLEALVADSICGQFRRFYRMPPDLSYYATRRVLEPFTGDQGRTIIPIIKQMGFTKAVNALINDHRDRLARRAVSQL